MGVKTIWDGTDLPPQGAEVLIHLADRNAYVKHKVDGFRLDRRSDGGWLVWVDLVAGSDPRSSKNCRFLEQCYPLDTDLLDLPVKGCLPTPRQRLATQEPQCA